MMHDILKKNGNGAYIKTIPMIIDTELFGYKELPKEFRLGYMGRIDLSKGLEDAIRVAAATGYTLRVAGTGPSLSDVKKLTKSLGCEELVEFAGMVPYEKMPQEYHKASVVLAPFRNVEPLGRVLLEANACGRPVITTNICGGSERVKDRVNGFVVEPADIEGMAEKVKELAADRASLERMGKNGRERILKDHNSEVIRKRFEAFYEHIIDSERRSKNRNAK